MFPLSNTHIFRSQFERAFDVKLLRASRLASKTWKDVKTSPELSDNAFQNLAYLLSTTGDSAKVGCAISECKSGVDVLVCSFEPSLEDKTQLFPK